MTETIIIPNNPIYDYYCRNAVEVAKKYDVRILRPEERDCIDLMLYNKASAAFLSPMGYGKGLNKADYRIIPAPALALKGYTKSASIYFRKGLVNLTSALSNTPEDFIIIVANIILNEMYDIDIKVGRSPENLEEMLKNADSVFNWGCNEEYDGSMDVSDEWFEFYDFPLPIGMWVCRNEEHPHNIVEILNELAGDNREDEEVIETVTDDKDYFPRNGWIIRQWNDEIEESLEQVMSLLFYHQYFSGIPAVKILGREEEEIGITN